MLYAVQFNVQYAFNLLLQIGFTLVLICRTTNFKHPQQFLIINLTLLEIYVLILQTF